MIVGLTVDLAPAHEEVVALKKPSKSWVAKKRAEHSLPDLFPQAKNCRSDDVALKSGETTQETAFLQSGICHLQLQKVPYKGIELLLISYPFLAQLAL